MLERVPLDGYTIIADKGFAGREFEAFVADRGAHFLRPDRKDEPARFGKLGAVRQWIESVFATCKGQLGLERHGAPRSPDSERASDSDCSPSPPPSGTTTTSVTQAATSPPTATDSESTI